MYREFVPEEAVFGLAMIALPIVLTAYFVAWRVARMIMRQRLQELVFAERLAMQRRGYRPAGNATTPQG